MCELKGFLSPANTEHVTLFMKIPRTDDYFLSFVFTKDFLHMGTSHKLHHILLLLLYLGEAQKMNFFC